MLGGNCHVAALQVALGSSEAIAHGIGKHWEVQKLLHADIRLVCLLIFLSIEYSLRTDSSTIFETLTHLNNLQAGNFYRVCHPTRIICENKIKSAFQLSLKVLSANIFKGIQLGN